MPATGPWVAAAVAVVAARTGAYNSVRVLAPALPTVTVAVVAGLAAVSRIVADRLAAARGPPVPRALPRGRRVGRGGRTPVGADRPPRRPGRSPPAGRRSAARRRRRGARPRRPDAPHRVVVSRPTVTVGSVGGYLLVGVLAVTAVPPCVALPYVVAASAERRAMPSVDQPEAVVPAPAVGVALGPDAVLGTHRHRPDGTAVLAYADSVP